MSDDEPRSDEEPIDSPDPDTTDTTDTTDGTEGTGGDESGTEIPISTGDGERGTDPTNDRTDSTGDADEDAATDEGVEIAVETGSPGPDVDRRSSEIRLDEGAGIDFGGSGTGIFDRLDESVVSVLSRALDTETHLRVYVALRRRPWSTAEAIAAETGLYPRTVRDALASLEARGAVRRRGPPGETDTVEARGDDGDGGDSDGDGRGEEPGYDREYAAIAPSAVLMDAVGGAERGLSEGFDLDRYLGSEPTASTGDPVRIDVEDDLERTNPDESDESKPETDDTDERDATEEYGDDEDSDGGTDDETN